VRPPIFSVDDRALDIALSRDRRTLYVGSTNGRIFALDALRGTALGTVKLASSGEVRRLLVLPDGHRLLAFASLVLETQISMVDLDVGRESATVSLGNRLVGRPVATPDVVVPVTDRAAEEQLVVLGLDPFRVRQDLLLASTPSQVPRTAAASLALGPNGAVIALSPFSLRIVAFTPGLADRTVVPVPYGGGRPVALFPGFDGDVTLAKGDTLHFCLGTGQRAERYRAERLRISPQSAGSECGRFAVLGDGGLYLAVRGRPELKELDPVTGAVRRTLALAGFPQRVAS